MAAPDAPASPPLHAAVNSAYQPKRQTFSRFFRRYPYGERRSRAVAPADARTANHTSGRRRRAGTTSEFGRMRDGSVMGPLRADQRLRLYIGEFMRKLYVELFFVMIVLAYGIFVVVQITMGDDALVTYKNAIDLTDITVGSLLLLEIALKVFAYGAQYLRNGWNLFDALVIVASFVLGLLAAMGTTSALIVKILRLRVILRVLRVLVVFERVKSRSKAMHFVHKGPITSPVEHVLRVLHELRCHPALRSSLREQIEFAIDVIKNNRLYEANGELIGAEVDNDTQNWLRGEVLKVNDTAKVLPDASDDGVSGNQVDGAGHPVGNASLTRRHHDNGGNGDSSNPHNLSMTARRSVTMKELLPPLDVASEFELQNLFRDVNSWAFDIFRVHVVSGGNALCHLGYHLLHELAASHLQVEQATLVNFLLEIQRGYIATNAYHNSIHAADVMQTVNYFLIQPELAPFLRPLDRALALLAAGIHDFKHDGFNNSFHILTGSEIALRYNDHAVLENFHVAQSFLVMKVAECNVLGKLSAEDFKYSREMIIQMVLATDMAKHFEDVALFKANILPAPDEDLVIKNVGDKKLLLKMILHTCDVSNPAKDRELMLKWTERVVEEFFVQGDLEKQLALAVSPFMDRETIVLKKMQVGFADFIVAPLFSVWAQILVNVNAVGYKTLLGNREFWSALSDDFKPYMIKDVLRDLSHRKRMSQASVGSVRSMNDDAAATHSSSRARRSVANLVLATDTGDDS